MSEQICMTDVIIETIRKNRISTTEIADCLNKTGSVPDVRALNRGCFKVGRVFWAYAFNGSNWECHEQLRGAAEGDIVIVDALNCEKRAVFGSLVSKYLILYKQVNGIVVRGYVRDVPCLIKEKWPMWVEGFTPIGCHNMPNETSLDEALIQEKRNVYDGAIAVCDDSGVVVIQKKYHDADFLERLDFIEKQEDVWFDCIDRLKWDTYETVCLKKYQDKL